MSWTDVNQGNAVASGTWRDGIYLYASPTDSNPEFLGSAGFGGTLAAGQSAQLSATVSLRQEVAGPYYIAVVPDYLEQVIEAGNTRLAALSSQATQILTPDLAVELVQSSATSAEFGQQFNVTWTVENTGDGTAIGTWSDKLYLSPQPTLGSSATFLATQPEGLNSPLAAGASYTSTATVTLPLTYSLASGTYYIIVVPNWTGSLLEAGASSGQAASPAVSLSLPPLPDLTVSNVSAPPQGLAGQEETVTWVDENAGTGAAVGSWTDTVYLFSDPGAPGQDDGEEGTCTFTGTLASGESVTLSATVTLPQTPGPYCFEVVANSTSSLVVSNTTNNTAFSATATTVISTPLPDLVVASITPPGNGVLSGTEVPVTYVITNQGDAPTSAALWQDWVILSQNPTLAQSYVRGLTGLGDQLLNNQPVIMGFTNPSYLNPGQSYSNTVDVPMPVGTGDVVRLRQRRRHGRSSPAAVARN